MGIKIHHGPDGTFKTSGAIKDDILPVIKNGRTLVTNVRGFSRENAVKVLGRKKVHKDFKVIFVDTEVQEGRDKLARFFHWAPKGAFFVVDEVQRIFKP
ncbi:MAG: zona occludens toxin, partial [Colwellia sp.]|nr:zona occludens toxin [Colwellia sp.]